MSAFIVLEAVDRPLPQGTVAAHVGNLLEPSSALGIEVFVSDEAAPVEEALTDISDQSFDLPFCLGPIGPTRSKSESPVMGEAAELQTAHQGAPIEAMVCDHHSSHLVEEDLLGHATESSKSVFLAREQNLHRLTLEEAQPQQPGVTQHDQQNPSAGPRAGENE